MRRSLLVVLTAIVVVIAVIWGGMSYLKHQAEKAGMEYVEKSQTPPPPIKSAQVTLREQIQDMVPKPVNNKEGVAPTENISANLEESEVFEFIARPRPTMVVETNNNQEENRP